MSFIYLFIQKPDSLLSEQETNSDKSVVKRLSLHVRGGRGGLLEKDGAIKRPGQAPSLGTAKGIWNMVLLSHWPPLLDTLYAIPQAPVPRQASSEIVLTFVNSGGSNSAHSK